MLETCDREVVADEGKNFDIDKNDRARVPMETNDNILGGAGSDEARFVVEIADFPSFVASGAGSSMVSSLLEAIDPSSFDLTDLKNT